MTRITIKYNSIKEKDKLINKLIENFKILKISKSYDNEKYKSIYIDLEDK